MSDSTFYKLKTKEIMFLNKGVFVARAIGEQLRLVDGFGR